MQVILITEANPDFHDFYRQELSRVPDTSVDIVSTITELERAASGHQNYGLFIVRGDSLFTGEARQKVPLWMHAVAYAQQHGRLNDLIIASDDSSVINYCKQHMVSEWYGSSSHLLDYTKLRDGNLSGLASRVQKMLTNKIVNQMTRMRKKKWKKH